MRFITFLRGYVSQTSACERGGGVRGGRRADGPSAVT